MSILVIYLSLGTWCVNCVGHLHKYFETATIFCQWNVLWSEDNYFWWRWHVAFSEMQKTTYVPQNASIMNSVWWTSKENWTVTGLLSSWKCHWGQWIWYFNPKMVKARWGTNNCLALCSGLFCCCGCLRAGCSELSASLCNMCTWKEKHGVTQSIQSL